MFREFLNNRMAVNVAVISILLSISLLTLVSSLRPSCSTYPAESQTAIQPCPLNDVDCIRIALDCELPAPRVGPLVTLNEMNLDLPYFNASMTQAPLISGLNLGNIVLLSIDYVREKINLNLSFKNIWINGTAEIYHLPSGLVTNTYVSEFYESINLTVVFQSSKSFNLEDCKIYRQFTAPSVYDFGDCLDNNPDPRLKSLIEAFKKDNWIAAAESFVKRGFQIVENFIDNFVCDI